MVEKYDADVSKDTLFDGRLWCCQHKAGYRFSIDAVLLAHFITPSPENRVLDLGAGCGVVGLVLAYRWPSLSLVAMEYQQSLTELCRQNIVQNGFTERFELVHGDLRRIKKYFAAGSFDWVVCNPPYRRSDSGRINPQSEQAIARHESTADLESVTAGTAYVLRTRGKAAFVYPAARTASLLFALKQKGLEPKRLQVVHSYPGDRGRLVLVQAAKGGGEEMEILPPLFIYKEPGGPYDDTVREYYQP